MNSKGLLFVAVAIVILTAFSAAIATAQNSAQKAESSDLVAPNNAGTFDTGYTQSSTFVPGKTETNSKHQTVNPQPKEAGEKRGNNKNKATPTEATPTKAAPAGGSGGSSSGLNNPSGGSPKELPRTGGPGA